MSLRPNRTIQKVLISTTSKLVGLYDQKSLLITHAWPDFYSRHSFARAVESPISRSAYIFAFETDHIEKKEGELHPNYSVMGDLICSYLSIFYGKRFDNHGLVEGIGQFHIPNLAQFSAFCDPNLPQNSHSPRVDFNVHLNLVEFARIQPLLIDGGLDLKFIRTLQSAGKFYLKALQNAEDDPEIAYLHLVTAGEILANSMSIDKDLLLDERIKTVLKKIKDSMDEGNKIANELKNRMWQIKRRFVETILEFVDDEFFTHTEAHEQFMGLASETFRETIAAAYDLRSRYVHTGVPFGQWISLNPAGMNNEVQIGRPVVNDKDLAKIIEKAPTLIGLERVIRYCLMRLIQHNIACSNENISTL